MTMAIERATTAQLEFVEALAGELPDMARDAEHGRQGDNPGASVHDAERGEPADRRAQGEADADQGRITQRGEFMSYKHDRLKQIETETREGKRFPCPQCDGTGQRCEGGVDGRPNRDDEGRW